MERENKLFQLTRLSEQGQDYPEEKQKVREDLQREVEELVSQKKEIKPITRSEFITSLFNQADEEQTKIADSTQRINELAGVLQGLFRQEELDSRIEFFTDGDKFYYVAKEKGPMGFQHGAPKTEGKS